MRQTKSNIFLASKRAPVTYQWDESQKRTVAELAPGGTANVVADQASYLGVSWIACAMSPEDIKAAESNPEGLDIRFTSDRPIRLHLLRHDPAVFERVQEIMTADLLWCSNNYLWDSWTAPTFDHSTREVWSDFDRFSRTFADAILEASAGEPDPVYLLHDYQLVRVPGRVRERRPDSRILLFIHIPWPAADYWRMLPRAIGAAILRDMLGASTIGFFAERWVRNFLACVADGLPDARVDLATSSVEYGGRVTRVEAMPLGYSPQAMSFRKQALDPELQRWIGDRTLVLHSGRTDPIKNAERAVDAFALALARDPSIRKACLLVRMNPNRLYVRANSAYLERVKAAVERANQQAGKEVVRLVCENNVDATFGCVERADVFLLNSTIDGQNLTAFESSLMNQRDAWLILSERAGAAEALKDVCALVNPFDIAEQAEALQVALLANPAARAAAAATRRKVVEPYSLPRWVDQQLESLGIPARSRAIKGGR